jgi:hypothetical protein
MSGLFELAPLLSEHGQSTSRPTQNTSDRPPYFHFLNIDFVLVAPFMSPNEADDGFARWNWHLPAVVKSAILTIQ